MRRATVAKRGETWTQSQPWPVHDARIVTVTEAFNQVPCGRDPPSHP